MNASKYYKKSSAPTFDTLGHLSKNMDIHKVLNDYKETTKVAVVKQN